MPKKKETTQKKSQAKKKSASKVAKKSTKKPTEKTNFEEELKAIYAQDEGNKIDLSKLEHSQASRFFKAMAWFGGIVLLLSLVAWAGFFFYQSKPNFSSSAINASMNGPFNALSGEKITYTLTINNKEQVTLEDITVITKLPNSFTLLETSLPGTEEGGLINTSQNYKFTLPPLKSGGQTTLELTGKIIGESGLLPTISAQIFYSPENYSSEFKLESSFTTEITDSLLAINAEYPVQTSAEEEVEWIVTIDNVGQDLPFEDLRVDFELPETLENIVLERSIENEEYPTTEVNESDTTSDEAEIEESNDEDANEESAEEEMIDEDEDGFIPLSVVQQETFESEQSLPIKGLNADSSVTYRLRGTFTNENTAEETLAFKVFARDARGEYSLQTEELAPIQVIVGQILATLSINGDNETQSVNFGESLEYTLTIENKSSSALGDLQVRAVIDSAALDWRTLDDPNNGTVSGSQILWTQEEIDDLRVLLPEDTLTLNFTIDTLPYETIQDQSIEEFLVKSFYEVTVQSVDNTDVVSTTETPVLLTTFNSNTQLESSARYFDGSETVGSGPLPPQVGEKTTYQIVWNIDNSFHEIENIRVEGSLPAHVDWEFTTTSDAGSLRNDGAQVIWEINRMPTSVENLQATFKVSVTPTENDINSILSLLTDITLTATDAESGGEITLTNEDETTNIQDDSGLVQE